MASHEIELTVDDTAERFTVESRRLLVHALRDDLGYTAPKIGCESGKCGACTVAVDGEAVKSCTVLAVQADGSEIRTAAGLGEDEALHPIQAAFHAEHGLQCGYCTPGMVTTVRQFLAETPDPDREAVRAALKGNLCRCTGYQNVVDAVMTAADTLGGEGSGGEGSPTDGSPGDGSRGNGAMEDGSREDGSASSDGSSPREGG